MIKKTMLARTWGCRDLNASFHALKSKFELMSLSPFFADHFLLRKGQGGVAALLQKDLKTGNALF